MQENTSQQQVNVVTATILKVNSFTTWILFLIISGYWVQVQAQPGPIKNLRYQDDFSYLKSDSTDKQGTEKLKYIGYSGVKRSYLSVGGELREWYELRKNVNFGDVPPGTVEVPGGSLQHRLMLHADWHINEKIRVFIQLNNTLEFWNPNEPIPEIIEDELGLHQAFLEIGLSKKPTTSSSLRIGRQEYSFGNELLISSREGPNNRQAFDGVTFIHRSNKQLWHILAATPVIINPKVFDNTHINEALWGVYGQLNTQNRNRIDLYYMGFYSQRRQFNFEPGSQHRHTFGTRFWNHGRKIYYDIDVMYQTGDFNGRLINAANLTGEVRYIFQDVALKPMVGIGASYITGDYQEDDNQLNTFDPMYPKPVYGLATPQGPSNISHIRPTFGIQPLDRLFINFRWYWLVRASNKDGTYSPSMTQVRPIPGRSSDEYGVALQYNLDTFYVVNDNLTFLTFISYVKPGKYVQETGMGLNVFFLAIMGQFKF